MIDYIFDWARDIYKASIISQLDALAEKPYAGFENTQSRMPTDSDISSLAGSQQKLDTDIRNWINNTLDQIESPQEMCSTSNLYSSASSIDVPSLELVHRGISIPSSNDSKQVSPNSSEQLGLDAVRIEPGQECINEYNLDRADPPSTESLDSDIEDGAVELSAAITDSVRSLFEKIATQDALITPPVTCVTEAESPLSEDSANAELDTKPPITQSPPARRDSLKMPQFHQRLEQTTPIVNIYDANPSPHAPRLNDNKTNETQNFPFSTMACSPATSIQRSPSLVPYSTPPLTPSRASATSPGPSISAAGSFSKRPSDLEGEDEGDDTSENSGMGTGAGNGRRAKRVRLAFTGPPPGADVVIID